MKKQTTKLQPRPGFERPMQPTQEGGAGVAELLAVYGRYAGYLEQMRVQAEPEPSFSQAVATTAFGTTTRTG